MTQTFSAPIGTGSVPAVGSVAAVGSAYRTRPATRALLTAGVAAGPVFLVVGVVQGLTVRASTSPATPSANSASAIGAGSR